MAAMSLSGTEQVATSRLWRAALVAAISAVVANLIVFVVARNVFGLGLAIPLGGAGSPIEPLPAFMVAIATAVPALAAAGLLALLARFTRRPILIFQIIATAFALLSLGGPLSLPVDTTTKLVLSLMHLVAAAVITGVLTTWSRAR